MEITLKKLLLAGIGSMAVTYEKAEKIVDELVKKGEIAVKDGKELNEELKKRVAEKKDDELPDAIDHLKEALSGLTLVTKKDIQEMKGRIEALEKEKAENAGNPENSENSENEEEKEDGEENS
jgi:polyhydroxyalkanoate synthesis regulator phasin